mgnify:FL=1
MSVLGHFRTPAKIDRTSAYRTTPEIIAIKADIAAEMSPSENIYNHSQPSKDYCNGGASASSFYLAAQRFWRINLIDR